MTSLRFKIILSTMLIGLMILIGVYFVIQDIQKGLIEGEFRDKGILLSNHLKIELTTPVLVNELMEIKEYIDNLKDTDPDIEYIFVTDREGIVLVHTFDDGFPKALSENIKPSNVRKESVYYTDKGVIHEFDTPLLENVGYVHLGMSETRLRNQIRDSSTRLLLLAVSAFVLWGIFIFFTGRWLTDPVLRLNEGAKRINNGILDRKIEVTSRDELGELASTFNDMAHNLDQKINDLVASKKQTETAQNYLETLFNSIDDGILVVNSAHEIIRVNKSLLKVMGRTEEELLGRQCHEVIFGVPLPEGDNGECPVNRLLRTRKPVRILHDTVINGANMVLEITGSLLSDSRGEINVILVLRDVTLQKALEAEIIARNRELTALNDISKNISESFEMDRIFLKTLENLIKLTGMERGEAYILDEKTGKYIFKISAGRSGEPEIIPPSLITGRVELVEDMSGEGTDETDASLAVIPLKLKDGTFGILTLRSRLMHRFSDKDRELFSAIGSQLGVAIENITFYNNIKYLKEFNEEILNNVNLAIHVVDRDMNILAVNDELIRLSRGRFRKEEMINRNLFEVYPFLKEKNIDEEYKYVMKSGEIFQSDERTEYYGDEIYTSTSKIPVIDHNGNVVRIITVMKDVTEQKRLEEELKDSYEELRLTYLKLKELFKVKESFLSSISHELRTPLTAIIGYTELMLDENISAAHRTKLEVILRNSQRLSRLIQGLLDTSAIESKNLHLNVGTLLIREMILQIYDDVRTMTDTKKITVDIEIPPNISVEGDRERLMQVFSNIMDNAIKFTIKGRIRITAADENEWVHLIFEDTGIGVPKDRLDLIFDRFYQIEMPGEQGKSGAGLGLWISKNIVEAHGGKIWAESKNRGSAFHVLLPGRRSNG